MQGGCTKHALEMASVPLGAPVGGGAPHVMQGSGTGRAMLLAALCLRGRVPHHAFCPCGKVAVPKNVLLTIAFCLPQTI